VLCWALDDGISGNDWVERNVPGKNIKRKAVWNELAGNMGEGKNTLEIFLTQPSLAKKRKKRKRKNEIPGKVNQKEKRKKKR
jgi:hypothetical protein